MQHPSFQYAIDCLLSDELEPLLATYRGLEMLIGDAHQISPREIAQLIGYLNDHLNDVYKKMIQALEQAKAL